MTKEASRSDAAEDMISAGIDHAQQTRGGVGFRFLALFPSCAWLGSSVMQPVSANAGSCSVDVPPPRSARRLRVK